MATLSLGASSPPWVFIERGPVSRAAGDISIPMKQHALQSSGNHTSTMLSRDSSVPMASSCGHRHDDDYYHDEADDVIVFVVDVRDGCSSFH